MKCIKAETDHVFFSREARGIVYDDGSLDVVFPFGLTISLKEVPPDRGAFDIAALNLADAIELGKTGCSVRKVLCDAAEMFDLRCADEKAIKDMVRRIGEVLSYAR